MNYLKRTSSWLLALLGIVTITGCVLGIGGDRDINLEYRVIGSEVLLKWDRQENVMFYVVQGSFMDSDWQNVGLNRDPFASISVSNGVFRFRVQGWGIDGLAFTSEPTDYIPVLPLRRVPDATEPGPGGQHFDPNGPRTAQP
ncbi:MAG: hypothetical protein AMJ65_01675 [Phycisphaerae bacterium SG8_4]|nr:MAG: hypothetical protein AMJ65_01675 [Phycisphaerae bacterium SG8_4]